MVALPDFDREFSGPPLRSDAGTDLRCKVADRGIARMGARFFGVGLIAAAFGLWVFPSNGADPAMMLIKLLFSIALFGAGMLGLYAARCPDRRPEVQIDPRARELRVLTPDHRGSHEVEILRFDDLQELSLRDELLSARDMAGRLVVSIEVSRGGDERALRTALAGAL